MKNDATISIVVPIYNGEKNLHNCLESIISQSFYDWEMILVDDGSKDNSYSICQSYANRDKRIKVIAQENAGVSAARNVGLQNSSGEYIVFVDSDDSLQGDALKEMLDIMKKSGADIVICGYKYISKNRVVYKCAKRESILGSKEIGDFIQRDYLEWLVAAPWGKLYRKSILPQSGFDETISLGEDLKFNVQCFCNSEHIEILDVALYMYNDTSNSLTKTYKNGNYEAICDIYNTTYNCLNLMNVCDADTVKNINYKLFSFCIAFMSQNISEHSIREEVLFIKTIVNNPMVRKASNNLPKISLIRKMYRICILHKWIFVLYILSVIKHEFID